jgi:hypothetical protein
MLFNHRQKHDCRESAHNQPGENPITTRRRRALHGFIVSPSPIFAVCIGRVTWIKIWWKAHFISPSLIYPK